MPYLLYYPLDSAQLFFIGKHKTMTTLIFESYIHIKNTNHVKNQKAQLRKTLGKIYLRAGSSLLLTLPLMWSMF